MPPPQADLPLPLLLFQALQTAASTSFQALTGTVLSMPSLPRLLVAAVAASALLLGLAWYLGDPGPREAPRAAAQLDGGDLPGRFDADPDETRENPLQAVERTTFLTEQDGKLTALSWEVLTPRTDFVSDVKGPTARVELGPGRLLVLEAAEGTVEHPGNDFQRGSFRGGTTATFHRLADPAGRTSDATAVLRLLLDAPTSFDRELGRLTTDGPVRVTGPRVDLEGEGLELDFSRAEEEVKKLELQRTDRLRLRSEERAGGGDDAPPAPAAAPSTPGVDPEVASPPGPAAEDLAPAPTLYRVEASGEVRVEADAGARLTGETLTVFFAAAEGLSPGSSKPEPAGPKEPADRGSQEPETAAVRGSEAGAAPTSGPEPAGSLFEPGPGTMELAWTGPLRLRPAEAGEGPEEVQAPGFRGAHLQLLGTPASPATAASGDARVSADALAYATAGGRLVATGAPGRPVRAADPAAGRLRAQRFEAKPDAGVATAYGPGELSASDPDGIPGEEALRVRFQEAMNLAFDPADGGTDAGVVLRRATFTGSVSVLAAAPAGEEPDPAGAAPLGSGGGGGPLTLEASRVVLGFAPPAEDSGERDARPTPESLLADGGVTASRAAEPGAGAAEEPLWTLHSEELRVALSPSPESPGRPGIDGLEAAGGVTVEAAPGAGADAPPLALAADRLVASPKLDRVELNGTTDVPATATRGGVTLTGGVVVAGLTGDRLEVRGPGSLDRTGEDGGGAATRLTWTDSLSYDGVTGEAEALGETLTTSESATERRRIEAGDVLASFDPAEPEAADADADAASPEGPGVGFASLRRLRASAPGGGGGNPRVVVVAETLGPGGAVRSTLRAEGPRLDLEVLPEAEGGRQLLTMPGPGRLILVDEGSPGAEDAASPGGVKLAGEGATFFRWNDALRLDGAGRDAELTGAVFMNHDPRDGSPRVKLYGDRLLAGFDEAEHAQGGDPASPEVELRSIRIDGNVVVESDARTITADHLSYLTDADEVLLWSDDPGGMSITAEGRTVRAGNAGWNLRTNRVDVRGVGGASEALR